MLQKQVDELRLAQVSSPVQSRSLVAIFLVYRRLISQEKLCTVVPIAKHSIDQRSTTERVLFVHIAFVVVWAVIFKQQFYRRLFTVYSCYVYRASHCRQLDIHRHLGYFGIVNCSHFGSLLALEESAFDKIWWQRKKSVYLFTSLNVE